MCQQTTDRDDNLKKIDEEHHILEFCLILQMQQL